MLNVSNDFIRSLIENLLRYLNVWTKQFEFHPRVILKALGTAIEFHLECLATPPRNQMNTSLIMCPYIGGT